MTISDRQRRPALDHWLPDALVLRDLTRLVTSEFEGRIELDAGVIVVPEDVEHDIVGKSWIEQRYDVGFGNCCRVTVAVGGVARITHGIIEARHCFCVLWYSHDAQLITVDFSNAFPGL